MLNLAVAHFIGISMALGVVAAWVLLFKELMPAGVFTTTWAALIWTALAAFPAAAIGTIAGLMLLAPFGYFAVRIQGGPFREGDPVWILIGPHKHTKTYVYEVWATRSEVRVDLGSEARRKCTDVYWNFQVCRVKGEAGGDAVD
jgi:hypothetical protein